tara:strand:- start:348 stop:569 length:222 start_codon:yes stop_codon:yes gene_type:complete
VTKIRHRAVEGPTEDGGVLKMVPVFEISSVKIPPSLSLLTLPMKAAFPPSWDTHANELATEPPDLWIPLVVIS